MTHGRNSAHFVSSTFLTIFGYDVSNAKSCQAEKIREMCLFRRIKYDVIMYILCTFENIMSWCGERGEIVFEPMAGTSKKSVRAQPMYTWWHGLVMSFTGELAQGHGKVISRSQQGQISSKRLKIPLFLFLISFSSKLWKSELQWPNLLLTSATEFVWQELKTDFLYFDTGHECDRSMLYRFGICVLGNSGY